MVAFLLLRDLPMNLFLDRKLVAFCVRTRAHCSPAGVCPASLEVCNRQIVPEPQFLLMTREPGKESSVLCRRLLFTQPEAALGLS